MGRRLLDSSNERLKKLNYKRLSVLQIFQEKGSFIWRTVPFCLLLSVFVMYSVQLALAYKKSTRYMSLCGVLQAKNLHASYKHHLHKRLLKSRLPYSINQNGQKLRNYKQFHCHWGMFASAKFHFIW